MHHHLFNLLLEIYLRTMMLHHRENICEFDQVARDGRHLPSQAIE
jgi:hypothetical protein